MIRYGHLVRLTQRQQGQLLELLSEEQRTHDKTDSQTEEDVTYNQAYSSH